MPTKNHFQVKDFRWGILSSLEQQSLPVGAAIDSLNWITKGDQIELRRGYKRIGTTENVTGKITGVYTATLANGTEAMFRKNGQKLEYYNSTTDDWDEVGTNIFGSDAEDEFCSFAEYHSLAGDQLWICSPNSSLFKIMIANPTDYTDVYDSAKNFKGYIKIKYNRMLLWRRKKDKTGIYGSYIDAQNFTAVADEATGGSGKTRSGTLAFKAGGAKRTCFDIQVEDGGGISEVFTDNYDGTLTSDAGGTGTINYTTGAYSVTFIGTPTGTVRVDYQWEDSTDTGIADFSKSGTRLAGEGFIFPQDDGGNMQTMLSFGDVEYCIHENKIWTLTLTIDDTNAENVIYRNNVGLPSIFGGVETDEGIYYIDVSDKKDPQIKVLEYGINGTNVVSRSISKQKKFANKKVGLDLSDFIFDECYATKFGDWILFFCKTDTFNNRVLVYNRDQKLLDILDYYALCATVYDDALVLGDSLVANVYEVFSGLDDDDSTILNYWISDLTDFELTEQKKVKKLVIEGLIGADQTIEVYASYDRGAFVSIGTISGTGSYVDTDQSIAVGASVLGRKEVGGGSSGISAFHFLTELAIRTDRFREVKLKFEATGIGWAAISLYDYFDIRIKQDRIPKRYR